MSSARSALPGFAIAIAVLIAGLLLALTVGRYPVSLGDLIGVLRREDSAARAAIYRRRSRASYGRCAGRA